MGELGDGRGDLEALVEDNLLALKADVFRPLDEASQVGLGLDVLAFIQIKLMFEERRRSGSPIPKFLGRASKRGFLVFLPVLLAKGAAAGFLEDLEGLGGWSLRRDTSAIVRHEESSL